MTAHSCRHLIPLMGSPPTMTAMQTMHTMLAMPTIQTSPIQTSPDPSP